MKQNGRSQIVTVTWVDLLEREVAPKFSSPTESDQGLGELAEIIQHVNLDCKYALEGYRRVLLHQEIASCTYTSTRSPIVLKDFVTEHFGARPGLEVVAFCAV